MTEAPREPRDFHGRVVLGRSGLEVSRLGLGSSFGLEERDVARAFERGVNYFYWGSVRRPAFGRAIKALAAKKRDELCVVVQTYTRAATFMRPSVESALRRLAIDHCDVLLLGWWNDPPPERIVEAALRLKAAGKARAIAVSCHKRATFATFARDARFDVVMARYNAAHAGAEREVFPAIEALPRAGAAAGVTTRPGVVAYTALCWGDLLKPEMMPPGEAPPASTDCYRFVLTNPTVDLVLAGPKNAAELDQALAALDRGPLTPDEEERLRAIGRSVHGARALVAKSGPVKVLDRWMGAGEG